ncbi:MAG: hypothetical protein CL793_01900 [Chloroflexi bacterium]|nr:hypothetical protein [Chloroflexota bacterium]
MKRRAIRTVEFISWTFAVMSIIVYFADILDVRYFPPSISEFLIITIVYFIFGTGPATLIAVLCRRAEPPSRNMKQSDD